MSCKESMELKYKAITSSNFRNFPEISGLSEEEKFAIEVVSKVLPFRANNYVVSELIDWTAAPDDPIFRLTFPQQGMLQPHHFNEVASAIRRGASKAEIDEIANRIRLELNPHPAGQMEHNQPKLNGRRLPGLQHKYDETVLFFPSQGQTCHAYCTFCFRWPQFVGMEGLKFAARESQTLVEYLRVHPKVTDILFTGGDPMIMKAGILEAYLEPILSADLPHLRNIRIGSKSLGYWPYKFISDSDADQTLDLFRRIRAHGLNLSFMAHFNHPRELQTEAVRIATERILETGAQIRTQSPIMRHINDDPDVWAEMWQTQVAMGMIPYYMFIARDTGAQHYFAVPLVRCWEIFQQAYSQVSGICRTVRGPSMSAGPGKVQVLGVTKVSGEKTIGLRFLQGRVADWVHRPFFAEYDPRAIWLSDLVPAFGEPRFFFEEKEPRVMDLPRQIPFIHGIPHSQEIRTV
jgi:KamA family protein